MRIDGNCSFFIFVSLFLNFEIGQMYIILLCSVGCFMCIFESRPGSGVPDREEVDAELEALSGAAWQPASALRCGLIPSRSAISTWSAGWM